MLITRFGKHSRNRGSEDLHVASEHYEVDPSLLEDADHPLFLLAAASLPRHRQAGGYGKPLYSASAV